MKNSALIAVGALLVGSAVGYLAGSSGKESPKTEKQAALPGKGASRMSRGSRGKSAAEESRDTKGTSLREILGVGGQTNRILSLLEYYEQLDPSEFGDEARKLQGLPMSQRMLAMHLLFARWAETDPQGALAESRRMGFPELFMARAGVLQGWAASNPESLAKQYSENPRDFQMRGPGRRGGGETVSVIAGEWAKQNPTAALEWARSLEGRDTGNAIEGIFREISQQDPKAAATLAATLGEDERAGAYESIAGAWAARDWNAARSWINTLSGDEREGALTEAVKSLAKVDPKKAATEALTLPAGERRDGLVVDVSRDWSREDPAAALSWLTANGSETAREEGVGSVIMRLSREDSGAAMAWVEQQPRGQVRDRAVRGVLMGNQDATPAETVALAETISDENDRQRYVERTTYRWIQEDPAAATNYVQSSTVLSEKAKERVLESAQDGGGGRDRFRGH